MPTTYISQLLHQITYLRYLIQVRGVEICVHYGFVWIFGWDFIRSIMSENCVISVLPAFLYIYSGQKYKNEDDTMLL